MSRPDRDAREVGVSLSGIMFSALIHVGLFAGMAWAGVVDTEQNEEPEPIDFVMVELQTLGEEPPPKNALPRIVKPPPPPPPPSEDVIKTGPREEELEKKKAEELKKKKELAEQRRKEEEEARKKREELERKRKEERDRKKRDRAMSSAFDNLDDPRAEDAPKVGSRDGHANGRSTNAAQATELAKYVGLVGSVISRQLKLPPIPREFHKKTVRVQFRVDKNGKLKGQPRVKTSSGNKACDNAAMVAVRRFGAGTALKIPLPEPDWLKKKVLAEGIVTRQNCGK